MNESTENTTTPTAAIICCSDLTHNEIIKNIIGTESLPEPLAIATNIDGYPWHIETKYYVTNINLIALKDKNLVSSEFANNIEAVLIHFDSEKVESFNTAKRWLPFLKHFSPQVSLLACNNCSSDKAIGLKREEIIKWCLENNFELVELNPEDIEDDEVEDDFQETKGYKRVVQAFHANLWSNLVMKNAPTFLSSDDAPKSVKQDPVSTTQNLESMSSLLAGVSTTENKKTPNPNVENNDVSTERIDTLINEDRWLFDAVGQEDPGDSSFETLFSKFLNLKEKADTLSGDEKKLYAEKVAVEFWRALGGDEDEIAGISDEEN